MFSFVTAALCPLRSCLKLPLSVPCFWLLSHYSHTRVLDSAFSPRLCTEVPTSPFRCFCPCTYSHPGLSAQRILIIPMLPKPALSLVFNLETGFFSYVTFLVWEPVFFLSSQPPCKHRLGSSPSVPLVPTTAMDTQSPHLLPGLVVVFCLAVFPTACFQFQPDEISNTNYALLILPPLKVFVSGEFVFLV